MRPSRSQGREELVQTWQHWLAQLSPGPVSAESGMVVLKLGEAEGQRKEAPEPSAESLSSKLKTGALAWKAVVRRWGHDYHCPTLRGWPGRGVFFLMQASGEAQGKCTV